MPEETEALLREFIEAALPVADSSRYPEGVMGIAMRVREALDARAIQAQQLSGLYETALDLAATKDLELLLNRVCRRARSLLGVDVAYLALEDVRGGDSYIRATDGVNTEQFKGLRLPHGAGIGGLVVQSGQPVWTSDYLTDARFEHTASLDSAIQGEALRSLVGVPLEREGAILGVLMAGNRHAAAFDMNQVSLLRSLATYAAIAIDRERVFSEMVDAVNLLGKANRTVEDHNRAIERSVQLHERLMSLLVENADLDHLLGAVTDVLGGFLVAVDAEGIVLGSAGHPLDDIDERVKESHRVSLPLSSEPPSHMAWTMGPGAAEEDSEDSSRLTRTVATMHANGECIGYLALTQAGSGQDAGRDMERVALTVALHLTSLRMVDEAELRIRGELLYELLTRSTEDTRQLERLAYQLSVDLREPHVVVCAAVETDTRRRAIAALAPLAREHSWIVGEGGGRVLIVVPSADPLTVAKLVSSRLFERDIRSTIGAAGSAPGATALRAAYREARQCEGLLAALGRAGQVGTRETLGAHALLFGSAAPGDIQEYIHATIGAVIDYDAAHSTDLVETLEAYFASGAHLGRTAAALHVHVNTLYGRLQRLTALLGDWKDPHSSMQVYLALTLFRLRSAAG